MIVRLAEELPFTAFEEQDEKILTGLADAEWSQALQKKLDDLALQIPFVYETSLQEEVNWNAQWEAGFDQITIDKFCRVRAPFHAAASDVTYDLIIAPRMAFGTGHHETTRLMIRALKQLNPIGKKVVDFGSGSGVLAILAVKMQSRKVIAVENDEHAIVNLRENIAFNGTSEIKVMHDSHLNKVNDQSVDLVLANITRNVLIEHAFDLQRILNAQGHLVVSGFLQKDHEIIIKCFEALNLKNEDFWEENEWIAQSFSK